MDEMVRRAAGRQQAGHRIDDRCLVDDLRQRPLARARQLGKAVHRSACECLPQRRSRIDERRVGNVQSHQLHHHLIAVSGTIKGASSRRVI